MATECGTRSGSWSVRCPGLTGDKVIGSAVWCYDSLLVDITDVDTLEWMRLDPESWASPAAKLEYERTED